MLDHLEAIAPTVLLEWEGTGSWHEHLRRVAGVLASTEQVEAAYEAAVETARGEITAAGTDPASTELSLVRLRGPSEVRLEAPDSFPGQVVDDLGFTRPPTRSRAQQADGDAIFVLSGSGFPNAPRSSPGACGPTWGRYAPGGCTGWTTTSGVRPTTTPPIAPSPMSPWP